MRTLSLSVLMLVALTGISQQPFSKVISSSTDNAVLHSAVPAFGGGYVMAGSLSNKGLVTRRDATGGIVWEKAIHNNNPNAFPDVVFNSINRTTDSAYVLAGACMNTSLNQLDAFVIKMSSGGSILWSKRISGTSRLELFSIEQTVDSGFVVTGNLSMPSAPNPVIFVAKLGAGGNLVWSKTFAAGNFQNVGNSIKQGNDGNYVFGGFMENSTPFEGYYFLVKLTPSGNILWAKKYRNAGETHSAINDFLVLPDGYLVYGGGKLVKTNLNGDVKWGYKYGDLSYDGDLYSASSKVRQTSDSHFTFVNGYCGDGAITNVDSTGILKWSRRLLLNALDGFETNDRGFFVVGNGPACALRLTDSYMGDIGMIKTDSLGEAVSCGGSFNITGSTISVNSSTVSFTSSNTGSLNSISPAVNSVSLSLRDGCITTIGGVNESALQLKSVQVYPNPFSSQTTLKFSGPLNNATLTIENCMGQAVRQLKEVSGQSVSLNRESLAEGVYFLRVSQGDKLIASGKLVITTP